MLCFCGPSTDGHCEVWCETQIGKEKIEGKKKKEKKKTEEEECALLVSFAVSGMLLRNQAGNVSCF